jgi:HD superfamily phosphodiesterase
MTATRHPAFPVNGIAGIGVPDDAISRATWAWAARRLPAYLFNHSVRSYAWGVTLAQDDGLGYDPRILWAASLIHDIGLTRIPRNTRCFEFQGAAVARRFLAGEGMAVADAARVGRAIELHMAPVVTPADGSESVLLDRATGIDVRGAEFDRIAAVRAAVVHALPRGAFDRRFTSAIRREVDLRPGCQSERLLQRFDEAGGLVRSPWNAAGGRSPR